MLAHMPPHVSSLLSVYILNLISWPCTGVGPKGSQDRLSSEADEAVSPEPAMDTSQLLSPQDSSASVSLARDKRAPRQSAKLLVLPLPDVEDAAVGVWEGSWSMA